MWDKKQNQGTGHTSSTSTGPPWDCCLIKIFKKAKYKQQGKIWLANVPVLWTLHSMTLQKGQNSSKNDDHLAKASIQWSPDYVSSANCLESDSALGISSLLKVVALLYRWLHNEQLEWDKMKLLAHSHACRGTWRMAVLCCIILCPPEYWVCTEPGSRLAISSRDPCLSHPHSARVTSAQIFVSVLGFELNS